LCKWQIDDRLQLVNNTSYDLDPLAVKCNNKARVAQGRNTFLCESIVSFLRSVQLYFALLAGVLSDKVKSDLYGLISHIFQKVKLLKSKIGSRETRHPLSLNATKLLATGSGLAADGPKHGLRQSLAPFRDMSVSLAEVGRERG
jgi:hypothetical protein